VVRDVFRGLPPSRPLALDAVAFRRDVTEPRQAGQKQTSGLLGGSELLTYCLTARKVRFPVGLFRDEVSMWPRR